MRPAVQEFSTRRVSGLTGSAPEVTARIAAAQIAQAAVSRIVIQVPGGEHDTRGPASSSKCACQRSVRRRGRITNDSSDPSLFRTGMTNGSLPTNSPIYLWLTAGNNNIHYLVHAGWALSLAIAHSTISHTRVGTDTVASPRAVTSSTPFTDPAT
jgi:hypothetical protein